MKLNDTEVIGLCLWKI